eukprot:359416-Chlamydomonas_euryale.AAC.5
MQHPGSARASRTQPTALVTGYESHLQPCSIAEFRFSALKCHLCNLPPVQSDIQIKSKPEHTEERPLDPSNPHRPGIWPQYPAAPTCPADAILS